MTEVHSCVWPPKFRIKLVKRFGITSYFIYIINIMFNNLSKLVCNWFFHSTEKVQSCCNRSTLYFIFLGNFVLKYVPIVNCIINALTRHTHMNSQLLWLFRANISKLVYLSCTCFISCVINVYIIYINKSLSSLPTFFFVTK